MRHTRYFQLPKFHKISSVFRNGDKRKNKKSQKPENELKAKFYDAQV